METPSNGFLLSPDEEKDVINLSNNPLLNDDVVQYTVIKMS